MPRPPCSAICGLSYAKLSEEIDRLAKALIAAGVRKGDRVATLSSPHPDYLIAFLSTGTQPTFGRSFIFGTLFAAGWSPCIGPILGGILGLATVSASVATGTVLLVAYAAGLAVPFLAVAMGATWVSRRLSWVGRHHHAVSLVTGAMLVTLGVLMLTNMLGRLATLGSPFGL